MNESINQSNPFIDPFPKSLACEYGDNVANTNRKRIITLMDFLCSVMSSSSVDVSSVCTPEW